MARPNCPFTAGYYREKGPLTTSIYSINKPGGSGAEALRYMKDKSGDDHTVMMTLNSFYTTPIIQSDLGVDPTAFAYWVDGNGYIFVVGTY